MSVGKVIKKNGGTGISRVDLSCRHKNAPFMTDVELLVTQAPSLTEPVNFKRSLQRSFVIG